ncbi:hypothetical protein N9908_01510 [Akkermansiaceae bacterium]|nr:hypothetical protein [Akkermansiaceae bacterium]
MQQIVWRLKERALDRAKGGPMAEVSVSASVRIEVKELTKGRARLSGGFRPKFDQFDNRVKGGFFTRVPWRSKPIFKIEAKESGNVFFCFRRTDPEQLEMPMEEVPDLIKGDFLGKFSYYRVYLEKGDSLIYADSEGFFVAGKISTL